VHPRSQERHLPLEAPFNREAWNAKPYQRPMQPEPIDQWIIDRIPLLVKLGRTEDTSTIPKSVLPNTWNFHFLWDRWDRVVENWDPAQITDLIKGLTHFEKVYSRGFGSVTPVAKVFGIYGSLVGANDRNDLAEWVLANTVNAYSPYGTDNHGAKSLAELKEKKDAIAAWQQATAARERERFEEARRRRGLQATEKLPNALRRIDVKAVAALLAKVADADRKA
jgi:hypothetical protein